MGNPAFKDARPQAERAGVESALVGLNVRAGDSLGELPLLVVSHGNGHSFAWYRFLQDHLASYGYIVFSHDNNTLPGIETARDGRN